jgi:alanine racemase
VAQLHALVSGRNLFKHAAASVLLSDPATHLDAVRPGFAMYADAVQIRTRLHEVRKGAGPAGYTEFEEPYHGVILAGYAHGLRKGPCLIGGRRSRIIEVGMQSSYVRTAAGDRAGDEVVLLGGGLAVEEIAHDWQTSRQEVLISLSRAAARTYRR